MLKTKIKAAAITNLTDARYFAAREVEWLGFDFAAGSDSYISPEQMLAIKEWVDGVKLLGEFSLEPPEYIRAAVAELGLDAVQLSMAAPETHVRELAPEVAVIRELTPDYYFTDEELRDHFEAVPPGVSYILLDLAKNGFTWADLCSGKPLSLVVIRQMCHIYPVLLALNFQAGEINDILSELPVKGLQLRGGEEEKTGVKSFDELDEILDLLEED